MTRKSQDTTPASQIDLLSTLHHDIFRYLLLFFDAASRRNLALTDKNNNAKVQQFKLRHLPRLSSAEQINALKKIFAMLTQKNLTDAEKEALGKNLALYNNTPAHSLRHVAMGLICLSYCQPLDDAQILRLKRSLRALIADAEYKNGVALINELLSMLTSKNLDMKELIPLRYYYYSSSLPNLKATVSKSSQEEFPSEFPEALEDRKTWTLTRLHIEPNWAKASLVEYTKNAARLTDGLNALTKLVESSESKEWAILITCASVIPLFTSKAHGEHFLCQKILFFRLITTVIKYADEIQLDALLVTFKSLTFKLFDSHAENIGIGIAILTNLILTPASREWAIKKSIEKLDYLLERILTNDSGLFLELFETAIEYANSQQLAMLNKNFLGFCQPHRDSSLILRLLPLISKKMEADVRFLTLKSTLELFLSYTLRLKMPGEIVTDLEKMFFLLTKEQRKKILLEITTLPEGEKSICYQRALVVKACATYADEEDVERILAILSKEKVININHGIVLHELCVLNKLPPEVSDSFIFSLIEMIRDENAILDLEHVESSTYALLALLIAKYQPKDTKSIDQLIHSLNEDISIDKLVYVFSEDVKKSRVRRGFAEQALPSLSILVSHLTPSNAESIDNILYVVFHHVQNRYEETCYLNKKLFLNVFNAIYSREDFEVSARLCRLIRECVKPKSPYFDCGADIMKTAEILLKSNALPAGSRLLFPGVNCSEEMFDIILMDKYAGMFKQRTSLRPQLFVGLFSNINSETALNEMMTIDQDFTSQTETKISLYCREVTEIKHLFRLLDFMVNSGCALFFGRAWELCFDERLACTKIIRDRIRVLNKNPKLNISSDAQLLVSIFLSRLISIQNYTREASLDFIFWCINRCNTLDDLREFRHAIFDSIENRALFEPILKRQSSYSLRWHEYRDRNGEAQKVSHSAVKIIEALQARMLALLNRRDIPEMLTEEDEAFLAQTGSGFTNHAPGTKCIIA